MLNVGIIPEWDSSIYRIVLYGIVSYQFKQIHSEKLQTLPFNAGQNMTRPISVHCGKRRSLWPGFTTLTKN